jgi:hypothetical protein
LRPSKCLMYLLRERCPPRRELRKPLTTLKLITNVSGLLQDIHN